LAALLPHSGPEVQLKTTSWSLIVFVPHSPTLQKFTISCKAAIILLLAFVVAFLTTVFLLLMFPGFGVNEADRVRLRTENQALRIDNADIAVEIGRLNTQMSRVEEHSEAVVALAQAD
jgi:hypothetical protein